MQQQFILWTIFIVFFFLYDLLLFLFHRISPFPSPSPTNNDPTPYPPPPPPPPTPSSFVVCFVKSRRPMNRLLVACDALCAPAGRSMAKSRTATIGQLAAFHWTHSNQPKPLPPCSALSAIESSWNQWNPEYQPVKNILYLKKKLGSKRLKSRAMKTR